MVQSPVEPLPAGVDESSAKSSGPDSRRLPRGKLRPPDGATRDILDHLHSSESGLFQRVSGSPLPKLAVRDLRDLNPGIARPPVSPRPRRWCGSRSGSTKDLCFAPLSGISTIPGFGSFSPCTTSFSMAGPAEYSSRAVYRLRGASGRPGAGPAARARPVFRFRFMGASLFRKEYSASIGRQVDYWKLQLRGNAGPPELPADRHVLDDGAHAAGREVFVCPKNPSTASSAWAGNQTRLSLWGCSRHSTFY